MTTASRIHYLLYRGQKLLTDPGNAGSIQPTQDLQLCEMVSGAAGETRTLVTPTKAGIRFVLRLLTHGGGDVTVTAAAGLNVALETTATFDAASDILSLLSVTTATGFRWEILEGNVATVVSSATPSSTPSATASSTPSSTPSATVSNTPSRTPSSTPSHTSSPSSTPSSTVSSTPSATVSSTPSAT